MPYSQKALQEMGAEYECVGKKRDDLFVLLVRHPFGTIAPVSMQRKVLCGA